MALTKASNVMLSGVEDKLMTQNVSNSDSDYPILLCPTSNANANQGDKIGIFGSDIKANPFTGTITANNFQGSNVALSDASINVSSGSCFSKTISADTTFTITGVSSGKCASFSLFLTNGGAYTVTWPNNVKWPNGEVPILTVSGVDILTFLTNDGGITWYGVVSSQGAS